MHSSSLEQVRSDQVTAVDHIFPVFFGAFPLIGVTGRWLPGPCGNFFLSAGFKIYQHTRPHTLYQLSHTVTEAVNHTDRPHTSTAGFKIYQQHINKSLCMVLSGLRNIRAPDQSGMGAGPCSCSVDGSPPPFTQLNYGQLTHQPSTATQGVNSRSCLLHHRAYSNSPPARNIVLEIEIFSWVWILTGLVNVPIMDSYVQCLQSVISCLSWSKHSE